MKPADILKHLLENYQELGAAYSEEETTALFCRALDSQYDGDEKLEDLDENSQSNRRQTWVANHALIMECVHVGIKTSGRIPAVVDISAKTKLSRVTVTKHLKYFERAEYLDFHRQKWKLATENLMKQVYASAFIIPDDSARLKAAALYLKYADKLGYTAPVEQRSASGNNFIQINNIFVNQEAIKALPEDKREAIEALILEANVLKLEE